MPPYSDIYVLTQSRTEATISSFLDRFVPVREETADDYCIPQHVKFPHTVFRTAAEVVSYCCSHASVSQSVYWRQVSGDDPAYAMVFFTSEGLLILGLSTDESTAKSYFTELSTHIGSDVGYITVEAPPPDSAAEFYRFAQQKSA
jgi:hypothetical protein